MARQKLHTHMGYEKDAAVDLVALFLKELWHHALTEIKHEIDVDCLPVKVAITVPAIWPSYARERMKEAARKAGINDYRAAGETTVALIEEPEAAALTTLFERREYPEIGVRARHSPNCMSVC